MDWYLVSPDGSSVLRAAPGLSLGVDSEGALTLNDVDPSRRWIGFGAGSDGAWLAAAEDVTLVDATGRRTASLPLRHGLVLRLAGNELCISRDLERPEQTGPVLDVVPLRRSDGGFESRNASSRCPSSRRRRRRRRTGGALVAAAGMLVAAAVAMPWLASDLADHLKPPTGQPEEISPSPVEADPTGSGVPSLRLVVPLVDSEVAEIGLPDEPAAADHEAVKPPAGPPDAALDPRLAALDTRLAALDPRLAALDTRLARARRLLDQGDVTFPPDANAVSVLRGVLEAEPGNAEAKRLLEACSRSLIRTARTLRESGLHYEARNTLEEILGFDPDNAAARDLLRRWIGSRPGGGEAAPVSTAAMPPPAPPRNAEARHRRD